MIPGTFRDGAGQNEAYDTRRKEGRWKGNLEDEERKIEMKEGKGRIDELKKKGNKKETKKDNN